MPLMPWHVRGRPECRRLDRVLREIDPRAFCVFNRALRRHEVWAPSVSQGEAMVLALESDGGEALHPDAYGQWVLAQLAGMRKGPEAVIREVTEHNERLARRRARDAREELEAKTRYVAPALQRELDGTLRHGAEDVIRGVRTALGER